MSPACIVSSKLASFGYKVRTISEGGWGKRKRKPQRHSYRDTQMLKYTETDTHTFFLNLLTNLKLCPYFFVINVFMNFLNKHVLLSPP